ncbi:dockerin type I domain-containing protein [Rubripirellula amarantea]|nr:dockerin type I domain-containing protein [Rubripirellula amarantea]
MNSRPPIARKRRRRLSLETLDSRRVLAAIAVTTVADTIDGADNQTSLREAIIEANASAGADTITFEGDVFAGAAQIDLVMGEFEITDSVTITGPGSSQLTIDAQGLSRVFNIESGASDVTLGGLTTTNTRTLGTNGFTDGVPNTTYNGGAIRIVSGGTTTLNDFVTTLSSTQGFGSHGGAVYVMGGTLELNDTVISQSRTLGPSANGGAIASFGTDITANRTNLTDNLVEGNQSTGGSVYMTNISSLTFSDGVIQDNQTSGEAARGGAIYSEASNLLIRGSIVAGNQTSLADSLGGAISTVGGSLSIETTQVTGNHTDGGNSPGGAISIINTNTSILNSLFADNETAGQASHGGGINIDGSPIAIVNSTFSNNRSHAENTQGGGIRLGNQTSATITHATFTLNVSGEAGSGIYVADSATNAEVNNSIIAGNLADANNVNSSLTPDLDGPADSNKLVVRYSLIGDNRGSGLVEAQTPDAEGRLVGSVDGAGIIDAKLLPLASNGGPTQSHSLATDSPAINLASNALAIDKDGAVLASDQRDLPFNRFSEEFGNERADMGAIELQPPAEAIIVWNQPANIFVGTAIDEAQLNATAHIPGTFVYTPASGTVLDQGNNQVLSLVFTPDDLVNFTTSTLSVEIDVVGQSDHGDAPQSYGTLTDDDGPFHTEVVDGPFLGSAITTEVNGQPSDTADSDSGDDGVVFNTSIVRSPVSPTLATLSVTVSQAAKLDAWIDFDGNGTFDQTTEHLGNQISIDLVAGENFIPFVVPANAVAGTSYARFRVSTTGGLLPTGGADDGEVEDYAVEITDGSLTATAAIAIAGSRINLESTDTEFIVKRGSLEIFRAPRGAIGRYDIVGDEFSNVLTIDQTGGHSVPESGLRFDGGDRVNTVRVVGDLTLDTSGIINLESVEAIDISDAGIQNVVIAPTALREMDPDAGGVVVFGGAEDRLMFTEPNLWRMGDPEIIAETFFTTVRLNDLANPLGTFVQANFGSGWHNIASPSDVNNNGEVTAGDALVIINELARGSYSDMATGVLNDPTSVDPWPGFYYDQNDDGSVTALDALRVINQLARISNDGSSEAEFVLAPQQIAHHDRDEDRDSVFADSEFIGQLN